MSVQIVRNINISGCAMPMMGMAPMPMMGMGGCCSPMMCGSVFCRPYPYMAMGGAVMAGACIGAALANPGVINAIGSGLKWGYNNLVLPVWNGVVKPVASWAYNNILKPIGHGLKWVWDHTLGWVLKKLDNAVTKKSEAKAEGAAQETVEEATEAEA